ncbi:MAG: exo-alpha-sialidase [Clostridia bacterium]|nr:exo-alpha-sialidase [Clostridia bacterium]
MFTRYLAENNVIGTGCVLAKNGDLILTYSTLEGKRFMQSSDLFRTTKEEWTVPLGSITANANLIRLKDGRLMTVVRKISEDPNIASVNGADYYAAFSDDDGRNFEMGDRINPDSACYYLMNQRLLRTHTGRILLPVCYVPSDLSTRDFFEKSGHSGCFFSDDEGITWQKGEFALSEDAGVDQLAEPMVVQGKGNEVLMFMRTGYGYLYYSVSADDGLTWSKAVPSSLRSPCAPFTVSFDHHSGLFFAVWDNTFPGLKHQYPRSPICLAKSEDGIHWETICELDQDPMKGYGYPMLYFTEKEILVTYYESPERKFTKATHLLKMRLMEKSELGI